MFANNFNRLKLLKNNNEMNNILIIENNNTSFTKSEPRGDKVHPLQVIVTKNIPWHLH
jgi:hypothetical protein